MTVSNKARTIAVRNGVSEVRWHLLQAGFGENGGDTGGDGRNYRQELPFHGMFTAFRVPCVEALRLVHLRRAPRGMKLA
jgi:hypothetical protein